MEPYSVISLVQQSVADTHNLSTSFFTSFLTIQVLEIGDKTFFLAMIMAMKYKKHVVLAGAFASLAMMSILSTGFGAVLPTLISKLWTDLIVTCIFFYFGLKLLHETYHSAQQETQLKEAEQQLADMNDLLLQKQQNSENDNSLRISSVLANIPDKIIFWEAFSMTFLAEWGDRSQIAIIILSASYNGLMIMAGACLGHLICTGLAVQLGEWISKRIKVKTIHYIAAGVFIVSGIATLISMINYDGKQHALNG